MRLQGHAELVDNVDEQVGVRRPGRCLQMAPTLHTRRSSAEHHQGQADRRVNVAVAHAAAVEQHRMIQQRTVTIRCRRKLLHKSRELLDMVRLERDQPRQVHFLSAVVRDVMVGFHEVDFRIDSLARLARHHETRHAGEVGLVGQRHEVEHETRMIRVEVRNAHRGVRKGQAVLRVLLGLLYPLLDVPRVIEVFSKAGAIARAQSAIEVRGVLPHGIENAGVEAHGAPGAARRCPAVRRAARTRRAGWFP